MRYLSTSARQSTGEICPGCDSEVLLFDEGSTLLLECDCGSVSALGGSDGLPAAA